MLEELPPPPNGRKGWPWTKESKPLAQQMPNGSEWPRISIVTPSYNQGPYIEETIRSVLLQNYPNLEYVIIDGGSTDETIDIIKKYEPWLTYWISESDRGQGHAINKGFEQCSGDIFNWLCSDDILLPEALFRISGLIKLSTPYWLIGNAFKYSGLSGKPKKIEPIHGFGIANLLQWSGLAIHQPSVYWNNLLLQKVGLVDENLHFCMDVDMWLRFYLLTPPCITDEYFSCARRHSAAKTTINSSRYEKYLLEFARWRLKNIYRSPSAVLTHEIEASLVEIQKKIIDCNRLKNHVVLGKVLKLWARYINKGLPV
jgi:glycosyltransferase involved in cell wall biosynthesis